MAQFSKGLRLDLADPLPRHVELSSDLLQSPRSSVIQAKSQAQNFLFPLSERLQHIHQLFVEQRVGRSIRRDFHIIILDKVPEVAVLLLADRSL